MFSTDPDLDSTILRIPDTDPDPIHEESSTNESDESTSLSIYQSAFNKYVNIFIVKFLADLYSLSKYQKSF